MKLVDILARELKVWPEGLECLSQLKGTGYIINGKGFDGRAFDALRIADETLVAGAIVTRAEWQAAVDALNAPKVVEWPESEYPPVGTVCAFMKHNCPPKEHSEWIIGDIRYFSDCTVVIGGDGCEHVHHPRNLSFRPVLTKEQVAAVEREKGIQAIQDAYTYTVGSCTHKILHSQAARLYDAGCRLQVAK